MNAKCYKKGYPRPKLVRERYELLDGEWDFTFDESKGERFSQLKQGKGFDRKIIVPYSYQTKKSGIGVDDDYPVVWYARTFRSAHGKGERCILHFEGVDHEATVFLNGERIAVHEGGYARFSCDVTPYLRGGDNLLVVRAEDRLDPACPRGKQRHKPVNTACFYTATTGIWRSVWLEYVPDVYIKSTYNEIVYGECKLNVHFCVNEWEEGLEFRVTAEYQGRLVARVTTALTAQEGEVALNLENRDQQLPMKPWSIGRTDQIYDLKYELLRNGETVDTALSYTGLVDYRADENRILVNYLPANYFRMVLDQGYYGDGGMTATDDELLRDVRLIKQMGFTGVRMHQKIEDERFYYFCDMEGLFVWCEMPSVYVTTDASKRALLSEWQEILLQYRGYLSIMAWVPFNESWGCLQVYENRSQQDFVNAAYFLTKDFCDGRFVVGNDGWEHTYTDLLTLHNYCQDGKSLAEAYRDVAAFAGGKRVSDRYTRSAFCKGYEYGGQPVLVSEYGGIKFSEEGGWGYGKEVRSKEEFYERLKELTAAITCNPAISGYCLTQFTDVMQEQNGLLREDRTPKIDLEKIAEINRL